MTAALGSADNPIPRIGARLLIRDPERRVLLIHERYRADRTHWITPGGGVEAGETLVEGAIREAFEETGQRLTLPVDAAAVLITRRRWDYAGRHYDQTDHFFALSVDRPFDAVPTALTPQELDLTVGSRWWRTTELRSSSEEILPPQLADVLDSLPA